MTSKISLILLVMTASIGCGSGGFQATTTMAAAEGIGAKGNGQTSDGAPSDLAYMPMNFQPPGTKVTFAEKYPEALEEFKKLAKILKVRQADFADQLNLDGFEFYETEALTRADLPPLPTGVRQVPTTATYQFPEIDSVGRTRAVHRVIEIHPKRFARAGNVNRVRYQAIDMLHEVMHHIPSVKEHSYICEMLKQLYTVSLALDRQQSDFASGRAQTDLSASELQAITVLQGYIFYGRRVVTEQDLKAPAPFYINKRGGGLLLGNERNLMVDDNFVSLDSVVTLNTEDPYERKWVFYTLYKDKGVTPLPVIAGNYVMSSDLYVYMQRNNTWTRNQSRVVKDNVVSHSMASFEMPGEIVGNTVKDSGNVGILGHFNTSLVDSVGPDFVAISGSGCSKSVFKQLGEGAPMDVLCSGSGNAVARVKAALRSSGIHWNRGSSILHPQKTALPSALVEGNCTIRDISIDIDHASCGTDGKVSIRANRVKRQ